jgi:hypothetical protein
VAKLDPQILAHLEWLGFVQPTGLVVSAPALVRAGAILDRRDAEGQRLLRECLAKTPDGGDAGDPVIPDFAEFAIRVLGWSFSPKGYAGTDDEPIPPELEVALPDYGETLRPDFAVRERDPADGAPPWQLLITALDGTDFDTVTRAGGHLEASAHGRMERLLRETGVPAGLLFNGRALRLISAPRGESSGWLEFHVAAMVQNAGRPISTAMRLLLREPRLLTLPRKQRLSTLLADSRKFQNEVSEKLAEQVLHALYELLRGFQAAHDASGRELLRTPLAEQPDEVYRALLTVILRLVFVLFAEERDMLPTEDGTFSRYYSIAGLHERLRDHAAHFPDTMDQRFGAWAQLLVLFRMVHDGATAGDMTLPARHGVLFDPDRFPFLEGRSGAGSRQIHERIEPPRVPDGTVYRALNQLLVLDGERISYRALDVEQIGSVYETMMGFRLETATGRSLAIKAGKKMGAPTAIDLDALLAEDGSKRGKWIQDRADRKLPPRVASAVKDAASVADLHSALVPVVDAAATPDLLPQGVMTLQPSEERRRSGSHYTPRSLTEPIVRTTLAPVLAALQGDGGQSPRPEAILELKVCDPAMGSGAFLVETCRQLGDALTEAWNMHGGRPEIPHDEDEVVFARRLVAQRCLYGVDRNPVAVDLAKMSLWLATLAREHALTFVDHSLRHGDSLVGLSRRQIQAFHWDDKAPPLAPVRITQHLERVSALRGAIRNAGDDVSDWALRDLWDEAQVELEEVRLMADLVVLAYFSGAKDSEREGNRLAFATAVGDGRVERYRALLEEHREEERPIVSFHWGVEFPEVFSRTDAGFDAIVGNPPFMGGSKISSTLGDSYLDWLLGLHSESHGNADLVAHFFRRAFSLLTSGGTLGLIATNTIGQGDTRNTGLRWICMNGGEIFSARRRLKWPGLAAVVVSVVYVIKGAPVAVRQLDDGDVDTITAFLFHRGGHESPARLHETAGLSFTGMKIYGQGFTFDDTDAKGVATALEEMARLVAERSANAEVIFPYIGGEEVNDSPVHAHHRYVISFFDRDEAECRRRWPDLMAIVEEKVRPERMMQKRRALRERWWQYGEKRPALTAAISELDRVLVCTLHSKDLSFSFLPARAIFSHALAVFPLATYAAFCALQSRPHEIWARFFGSSMKDDLRYTPSDCFETFPFSEGWESHPALEEAGGAYYAFRAELMVANDEGLTKTYNRFHDPDDRSPEITRLRGLHAAMDRVVLDAYGWTDISTECEFLLDYEDDDDEGSGRRKKPWRYRWPDDVHDEVLARLIELNAERAAAEVRSGATAEPTAKRVRAGKAAVAVQTEGLF